MKSQTKHSLCKKVVAMQESKKAMMKKMWNQSGQPRPPAVDGIKIFDNDDQAVKHYCCLQLQPGHHYQKF